MGIPTPMHGIRAEGSYDLSVFASQGKTGVSSLRQGDVGYLANNLQIPVPLTDQLTRANSEFASAH